MSSSSWQPFWKSIETFFAERVQQESNVVEVVYQVVGCLDV